MASHRRKRSRSSTPEYTSRTKKARVLSPTRTRRFRANLTTDERDIYESHRPREETRSKRPRDEDDEDEEETSRAKRVMTSCERPKVRSDGNFKGREPNSSRRVIAYEKPKVESDDDERHIPSVPSYVGMDKEKGRGEGDQDDVDSDADLNLSSVLISDSEEDFGSEDDDEYGNDTDGFVINNTINKFSHGNIHTTIFSSTSLPEHSYLHNTHSQSRINTRTQIKTFKNQTLISQNLPNGASISGCSLVSCNGKNLLITNSSFSSCNFNTSFVENCSFSSSNLNDCTVIGCSFSSCNVKGGAIQHCSHSSSNV